jgi:hypothetical protein
MFRGMVLAPVAMLGGQFQLEPALALRAGVFGDQRVRGLADRGEKVTGQEQRMPCFSGLASPRAAVPFVLLYSAPFACGVDKQARIIEGPSTPVEVRQESDSGRSG